MITINDPTFTKDGTTYMLQLGTIERTTLGYEDHGIFMAWLMLEFDGSAQGAGGYVLDNPVGERGVNSRREGTAYGMDHIIQLLKVVGVEEWEALKGKHIYAIREESYGPIVGLAHFKKPTSTYFFFKEHANAWKDR